MQSAALPPCGALPPDPCPILHQNRCDWITSCCCAPPPPGWAFCRAAPALRAHNGVENPRCLASSVLRQSPRSEEHTSELKSLMRISYAVFCLKKKKNKRHRQPH